MSDRSGSRDYSSGKLCRIHIRVETYVELSVRESYMENKFSENNTNRIWVEHFVKCDCLKFKYAIRL